MILNSKEMFVKCIKSYFNVKYHAAIPKICIILFSELINLNFFLKHSFSLSIQRVHTFHLLAVERLHYLVYVNC